MFTIPDDLESEIKHECYEQLRKQAIYTDKEIDELKLHVCKQVEKDLWNRCSELLKIVISDVSIKYFKKRTTFWVFYKCLPDRFKKIIRDMAEIQVKSYCETINNQDELYQSLGRKLKSSGAIVLTGAGLSAEAGLPITNELDNMGFVCYKKICPKAQKEDCFDAGGNLKREIWRVIQDNDQACERFRRMFKNKCDRVTPSESHKIICDFFKEGAFLEIIDANWDNLLERAYRECSAGENIPAVVYDTIVYGQKNCRKLWKVKGSVEHPNVGKLTLPFSYSKLPDALVSCIGQYEDQDYFFLTIGYSGRSDLEGEDIMSQIDKISDVKEREHYHIRPDLSPNAPRGVLIGLASVALRRIREYYYKK